MRSSNGTPTNWYGKRLHKVASTIAPTTVLGALQQNGVLRRLSIDEGHCRLLFHVSLSPLASMMYMASDHPDTGLLHLCHACCCPSSKPSGFRNVGRSHSECCINKPSSCVVAAQAAIVVAENGKNKAEALASVAKGNETVEWACSMPQLIQVGVVGEQSSTRSVPDAVLGLCKTLQWNCKA